MATAAVAAGTSPSQIDARELEPVCRARGCRLSGISSCRSGVQHDFAAAGELNAEHADLLSRCDAELQRLRQPKPTDAPEGDAAPPEAAAARAARQERPGPGPPMGPPAKRLRPAAGGSGKVGSSKSAKGGKKEKVAAVAGRVCALGDGERRAIRRHTLAMEARAAAADRIARRTGGTAAAARVPYRHRHRCAGGAQHDSVTAGGRGTLSEARGGGARGRGSWAARASPYGL